MLEIAAISQLEFSNLQFEADGKGWISHMGM